MIKAWARPLFSMWLKVTRMEIAIAITAVLGNAFGHIAVAICALDCKWFGCCIIYLFRFPIFVDQWYV